MRAQIVLQSGKLTHTFVLYDAFVTMHRIDKIQNSTSSLNETSSLFQTVQCIDYYLIKLVKCLLIL